MDSKKRNKCGKRKVSSMYAKISEVQDLREKQWRELHKKGPFPKKLQAVKHATKVSLKSVMIRQGEVYPRRMLKILYNFGDEYDCILKRESENLDEILWKCITTHNFVPEDQVENIHYCNSKPSSSGISNTATAVQKTNDEKSLETYPNIENIMNQKLYTDNIEGSSSSDYEDDIDDDGDDLYKTDTEPLETETVKSPMILPGPSCSYTQPDSSSHIYSKSFQDPSKAVTRKRLKHKQKNEVYGSQFWNGAWMKDFLKSGYKRIKEKQENPPEEFNRHSLYRNRRGNAPIIVFPDENPANGNQAKIDLKNAVGFERFVLQDLPYISDYELSGEDEIAKLCENDDIFKDPFDIEETSSKAVSDPEHMKADLSESKKIKSMPAKPSMLKVTKSKGEESSSTSTASNLKSKETKGKACTSIKMSAASNSKQKFKLTKQKVSTAITSPSTPKCECKQNGQKKGLPVKLFVSQDSKQKSSEGVKVYKCFRANASFIPKHPNEEENSSLSSTSSEPENIETRCKGRKHKAKEPYMIKEKPKKPKREECKSSKKKNISYSDDKSKIKKGSNKK